MVPCGTVAEVYPGVGSAVKAGTYEKARSRPYGTHETPGTAAVSRVRAYPRLQLVADRLQHGLADRGRGADRVAEDPVGRDGVKAPRERVLGVHLAGEAWLREVHAHELGLEVHQN